MEIIKLYQYGNTQSSKITPTPLLLSDEPVKYRIISDDKKILFEKEKSRCHRRRCVCRNGKR